MATTQPPSTSFNWNSLKHNESVFADTGFEDSILDTVYLKYCGYGMLMKYGALILTLFIF